MTEPVPEQIYPLGDPVGSIGVESIDDGPEGFPSLHVEEQDPIPEPDN